MKIDLTSTAARFLRRRLGPESRVFEYGSGGSTLFFAKSAGSVVSMEHDPRWFRRVADALAAAGLTNASLRLAEPGPGPSKDYGSGRRGWKRRDFGAYVRAIDAEPDASFDAVLVDGRSRVACVRHAMPKVKPGGLLVLDDSQRARYRVAWRVLDAAGWKRRSFFSIFPPRRACAWTKPG